MSDSNESSFDTNEVTFEHLKEVKHEREQEVKRLMVIVANNQIQTLDPETTPELIRAKRLKFIQSMQKLIDQKQPRDLVNTNSDYIYHDAVKDIENEIFSMNEIYKNTCQEVDEIQSDIHYMEKKLASFKEMMKGLSNHEEDDEREEEEEEVNDYEAETAMVKKIFMDAKKDLANLVELLFPNNPEFQELFMSLTRAVNKGGDDIYVEVKHDQLDLINFLEDAAIVQFHPNDTKRIKLREF